MQDVAGTGTVEPPDGEVQGKAKSGEDV